MAVVMRVDQGRHVGAQLEVYRGVTRQQVEGTASVEVESPKDREDPLQELLGVDQEEILQAEY